MNLLVNECCIKILVNQSEDDLQRIQMRYNGKVILLGERWCYENITIINIKSIVNTSAFWIAILSENKNEPFIFTITTLNKIVIGFDKSINLIDLIEMRLLFEVKLNGIIIFSEYRNNKLLVITEMDILQIDMEGNIINDLLLGLV